MELKVSGSAQARSAATYYYTHETFGLAAGKRLNVRYWAPGETDALDVKVPSAKKWEVTVTVSVIEMEE